MRLSNARGFAFEAFGAQRMNLSRHPNSSQIGVRPKAIPTLQTDLATKADPLYLICVAIVAAVYFGAAKLGLSLAFLHASVSPVWPPTGIAIAAVLWLGYRISPAILLGAFFANLATGESVATAGGIAIGNTLEAMSAAFLLHRFVGFHSPFYRARDVLKFVLIAVLVSPMVSATIGGASLCLGGAAAWANFGSLWLTWWIGDGVGALVVAPLVLTWVEQPAELWPPRRLAEGLLLLSLLAAASAVVFREALPSHFANLALARSIVPFLLWAAFRLGPRGVALAIALFSGIAIWGTRLGLGPIVDQSPNDSLLLLQVSIAAYGITFLVLAGAGAERKSTEQALSFLASIVESTDDAVIGQTPDGTILTWNKGAERLYGYAAEDVVGRPISMLIPADRADELPRILEHLKRGEPIDHYETERVRKDGRVIFVTLTVSPIKDSEGRIVGASAIEGDITKQFVEQKRAQEALRQSEEQLRLALEAANLLFGREREARAEAEAANRAKDEFLALVSHELRTPLNSIAGWVDIVLAHPERDEAHIARALEVIKRNAGLQTRIIDDILDVSRIVTGKLTLEIRPVDLPGIIQAAIRAVQPTADEKQIPVRQILDRSVDPVSGDPYRLQQIVWNLLSNAIKFTPDRGEVEIRLEQTGSNARVTVSDSGEGIRTDFLPRIFDRFSQADSSTTRAHGGLGLGLAIVRYMVELHGGTVEAYSAGEKQGATFTVILPCEPAGMESGTQRVLEDDWRSDDTLPLAGLKVLVVDDDLDSREVLAALLVLRAAEVRSAGSVREALEALAVWKPDVLVSDIGMPGEDGYDLIREVRSRGANEGGQIPAIALTGYTAAQDGERALTAGYQTHLAKPVEPRHLVRVIASFGDKSRNGS